MKSNIHSVLILLTAFLFLVFNNSSAKYLMPAARNTIYGQNYWPKKSLNL